MTTWMRLQKVLEGHGRRRHGHGAMSGAWGVTLALKTGARDLALGASRIESEVRIQRARLVPGMGAPVRLTAAALVA
jgi:hypothetical protein